MFLLKACPRCTGDLYMDRDDEEPELNCMQCGFRSYGDVSEPSLKATAAHGEPALAGVA